MPRICVIILAAAAILGSVMGSATAQDNGDRTIDQFTCKDILRENGAPREVAVAFLHGYLLGKGATPNSISTRC